MNKLVENGLINEITCGENLAYILEDSSLFIPIEYKVMQSQTDKTFIKCMKLLFNGKIQLYYLTDNHKSLKNILHSLNAESFMIIMGNLFSSIITVKNNGFLSCQNIDVSLEHIFVHPATYKVSLVYLPIRHTKTPVARGSKVPVCPIFLVLKMWLSSLTTSLLVLFFPLFTINNASINHLNLKLSHQYNYHKSKVSNHPYYLFHNI